MPRHQDMTGSDLHEPKGVDAASANTVYLANGSGSGTWSKVTSSAIGTTTIKNLNKDITALQFTDIGTAGSLYYGIGRACTLAKIVVVPQGVTATADTILTFRNDAGTSMGTITLTSGAAAGTVFTLSPASNNVFVADTKLQIDSDGGTSTTTLALISLELVWS